MGDLTSGIFLLFLVAAVLLYYVTPRDLQWTVLLLASVVYYASFGMLPFLFLLCSVLMVYFCAAGIAGGFPDETNVSDAGPDASRTVFLVLGLCGNLCLLGYLKYAGFFAENINRFFSGGLSVPALLLPFGISYYTFQSLGYLIDVHRGLIKPEKNPFRLFLFVSFFPQLAQGPIGRYDRLSPQLFQGRFVSLSALKNGSVRIVWGLFKKMVIADTAHLFRTALFEGKAEGAVLFAVLFFSAELYGNFSGGVDIAIGAARLFGITLDENFRRPFFARTLSEFWQRWHITLGSWMKDYVFYPLARTRLMSGLGKALKKDGGKLHKTLPQGLCSVIVFTLVGLWHGADWGNIGWGLFNGVVICFSGVLGPLFAKWKTSLHIDDKSRGYRVFCVLRTFALINFSWYFTCADSAEHALSMIRKSVTRFAPAELLTIEAGRAGTGTAYTPYALLTLAFGILLLFVVSYLQETGRLSEERIAKIPLVLQYAAVLVLLFAIPVLAPVGNNGGFLYAQF